MREWFQAQGVGVQTLLLIAVGLLVASPYWLTWIYVRRRERIKRTHEELARRGAVRATLHSLPWYEHPSLKALALLTLAFLALRGFQATQGTFWFFILNVYYWLVVLYFARKAFSQDEFERERSHAPVLDRKTDRKSVV